MFVEVYSADVLLKKMFDMVIVFLSILKMHLTFLQTHLIISAFSNMFLKTNILSTKYTGFLHFYDFSRCTFLFLYRVLSTYLANFLYSINTLWCVYIAVMCHWRTHSGECEVRWYCVLIIQCVYTNCYGLGQSTWYPDELRMW